uniref:Uncharacterized protein n=1 Tax=Arundo donax TaxID=35708 RepID=A0A0A9G5C7_ARUDO
MSRFPWLSPCRTRMIRLGSRRAHCGWCCRVISQNRHSLPPTSTKLRPLGFSWPATGRAVSCDMAGARAGVYITEQVRWLGDGTRPTNLWGSGQRSDDQLEPWRRRRLQTSGRGPWGFPLRWQAYTASQEVTFIPRLLTIL